MNTALKIETAARRLEVSARTIRRLVHGGQLVGLKIGSALRVQEQSLERFIRKQSEKFSLDTGNYCDHG